MGRSRRARRWIAAAAGALLAGGPAAARAAEAAPAAASAGVAFRSEAGRFSVVLPALPVEHATSHLTLAGPVHSTEFSVASGSGEFRVEVHRIPAVARWILSEQSLLERAARELVADEGGRTLEAGAGTLDGRPAWQVAYRVEPDRAGQARLQLRDGRLYVVALLAPGSAADGADASRFFASFRAW